MFYEHLNTISLSYPSPSALPQLGRVWITTVRAEVLRRNDRRRMQRTSASSRSGAAG
jgi:hypothetical protein